MSGYPSGLSATAMELLLRYFYTPVEIDTEPDAVAKARMELLQADLIEFYQSEHGIYRLTERGEVMARHIMRTPLPVHSWQMPDPQRRGTLE